MDIQLKKGLIEICVLKCLTYGDSYGYEIINRVAPHMTISESTLYPILRRLEAAGCLNSYTQVYNGRLRKYYSITGIGRERIRAFMEEWKSVIKIYEFIMEDNNDKA